MAKLVLIKHAHPVQSPDVPSARWVLSDDGRARCGWLGAELRAEGVSRLFSSLEPKALETAALAAVVCALPVEPRGDLHENDRSGLGYLSADEMQSRIKRFLTEADAKMGPETVAAARERFARAIGGIPKRRTWTERGGRHACTVLTLFVARHNAIEPFEFWQSLTLPSFVVLDSQSLSLIGPVRTFPNARA